LHLAAAQRQAQGTVEIGSPEGHAGRLVTGDHFGLRVAKTVAVSESEWQAIEPMFDGRSEKKHSLRDIINLILFKLGTGQAWRKLDFGELNFPIVQATYQRMTKLGQWQTLAARGTRITVTQLLAQLEILQPVRHHRKALPQTQAAIEEFRRSEFSARQIGRRPRNYLWVKKPA